MSQFLAGVMLSLCLPLTGAASSLNSSGAGAEAFIGVFRGERMPLLAVCLPLIRPSALEDRIYEIDGWRPLEQVIRVDAQRVIARVTNVHAGARWAAHRQFKRQPVCGVGSPGVVDTAVALPGLGAKPFPALAALDGIGEQFIARPCLGGLFGKARSSHFSPETTARARTSRAQLAERDRVFAPAIAPTKPFLADPAKGDKSIEALSARVERNRRHRDILQGVSV